jgi:hypothetical protein
MHWISFTFLAACAVTAAYTAYLAYSARRDADNWVLDPRRGGVRFSKWTEFSLASLVSATCCGVVVFGLFP